MTIKTITKEKSKNSGKAKRNIQLTTTVMKQIQAKVKNLKLRQKRLLNDSLFKPSGLPTSPAAKFVQKQIKRNKKFGFTSPPARLTLNRLAPNKNVNFTIANAAFQSGGRKQPVPRRMRNRKMNPISPQSRCQEALIFPSSHQKFAFSSRYIGSINSFKIDKSETKEKVDPVINVRASKACDERNSSGLQRFKLINGELAEGNSESKSSSVSANDGMEGHTAGEPNPIEMSSQSFKLKPKKSIRKDYSSFFEKVAKAVRTKKKPDEIIELDNLEENSISSEDNSTNLPAAKRDSGSFFEIDQN